MQPDMRTLCEYSECRPYLIDLGSTNGSFINGVSTVSDSLAAVALAATPRAQIAVSTCCCWYTQGRLEAQRYVELREGDILKERKPQQSLLNRRPLAAAVVFNYEDALMRRRLSWTPLAASAIRRENTFSWLPTSE